MKKSNTLNKVKKIVSLAIFGALAYATMFIVNIKVAGFLTFDAKDSLITIAGLIYGPLAALIISFLVALLEMITVSGTGIYGFIMNFAATATFACVCSLIYKYRKNIFGAVVGLLSSVASMTAIMILMNLVVTPLFLSASVSDVIAMIPTILLPFNLTKAVLNGALVLTLYKPIKSLLKVTHLYESLDAVKTAENKKEAVMKSVIISLIGLAIVVLSVCIFVFVLKGSFSWF